MGKIDVSYTAKPDPLGRRLFLDTETGLHKWEQLPDYTAPAYANPALTGATEEYHAAKLPATVDAELAKVAFGMTIDAEKKFEAEAKPTRPVKHRKSHEGDK